jgi:hypothetical protein
MTGEERTYGIRIEWTMLAGKMTYKFFHACASHRKSRNFIKEITDSDGKRWNDQRGVESAFTRYFHWLYKSDGNGEIECCVNSIQPKIYAEMNHQLVAPVSMEEIQLALYQMDPLKAPGPDGFPACFFQQNWEILHKEVFDAIKFFFDTCQLDVSINYTVIALIPKTKNPKSVLDFRPISLCNVVYKVLSKVLANRLKVVLPSIISESQSAFIPGRLITDNIIAAFETMHTMDTKMWGRTGYMGIKLDMSKAYDRVEWLFLEAVMSKMGFDPLWIKMIMVCVRTVSYSVAINGNVVGNILPSRGLRQGDPISPYLFIICAEAFSSLLSNDKAKGLISGVPTSKKGPSISHLFFADDSVVFCKANRVEWRRILNIIEIYERGSGHKINVKKTAVFFSRNTNVNRRKEIIELSGLVEANRYDSYLGLPILVGKNRSVAFYNIKEKVSRKIYNWKYGLLSLAGKEVLLKAVVQAIPTYSMSVFLLPVCLCKDLNHLMQAFWWGNLCKVSKIHWMSWTRMGRAKSAGGLGFRDLILFNKALLSKQCWRVIQSPDSLSSRIL